MQTEENQKNEVGDFFGRFLQRYNQLSRKQKGEFRKHMYMFDVSPVTVSSWILRKRIPVVQQNNVIAAMAKIGIEL